MTYPNAPNWRDIGDVPLAIVTAILRERRSPMLSTASLTHAAAQPHSALFWSQAGFENQWQTTGIILGPEDHNPVALRPERLNDPGPYGAYVITAPDGGQFLGFATDADCAREWRRRITSDTYKGGVYARTTTLADYLAVYAPGDDVHPVTGVANADAAYLDTVTRILRQFAAAEGSTSPTPSPEEPAMATHRYILSAGHRNTDGGGAWRGPESAWTYPICKQLKAAIERRGGKAWIISEEDGDSDPTFSHGRGLQNAARLCVDLANAVGGVDAYISMHYGAEPVDGFFTIYPDAAGLSPSSSVDVAANNPLDIQLSRVFAKHVAKTGMPIRGDGTMSERRSGVGLQGYRLGEFYGTIGFRDTTARVIVEGGNSLDDAEYNRLWSPQWQAAYVEALVDGLEEVFGAFPKTTPEPAPTPEPEKPVAQYPAAKPIAELADKRPYMITDGKSVLVRADLVVKATKATPRLMYASADSERIGPDIAAGEQFSADYIVINPDQSLYWYTPWGTRVRYEDTEIIGAES